MPQYRDIVFTSGEYYHVFNRGVERRPIFTNDRDYKRALATLTYYRSSSPPVRFSKFLTTPIDSKAELVKRLAASPLDVSLVSYCLMPNHFHFLVQQLSENGVPKFVSKFSNSYTKYFNTKHSRVGPLLQGNFKAVLVESEEQLLHLSRYIHINPVVSSLVKRNELSTYRWSSFNEYLTHISSGIVDPTSVMFRFPNSQKYLDFCQNHLNYAQELERIKHLTIDIDLS